MGKNISWISGVIGFFAHFEFLLAILDTNLFCKISTTQLAAHSQLSGWECTWFFFGKMVSTTSTKLEVEARN